MKFLHPVYPITDTALSGLTHHAQVRELALTGVGLIQLREKSAPSRNFYDDAKEALDIARSHSVKLIINDRVDIALAIGADGVHLGQDDLSPIAARKLLGNQAVIGFSTHTFEQATAALSYPVDYIAVGPVFSTSTKTSADDLVGIEELKRIRKAAAVPLVAIGGISLSNINDIASTGVDSAAVISALFDSKGGIKESVAELKDHWLNKNV